MKTYKIPVEFSVTSKSEKQAMQDLQTYLNRFILKSGLEYVINDQYLTTTLQKSSYCGCGDHDSFEGVPI